MHFPLVRSSSHQGSLARQAFLSGFTQAGAELDWSRVHDNALSLGQRSEQGLLQFYFLLCVYMCVRVHVCADSCSACSYSYAYVCSCMYMHVHIV